MKNRWNSGFRSADRLNFIAPELQDAIDIDPLHDRSAHFTPHSDSAMPTPYEKSRDANIKRNTELLKALGLDELKKYIPPKITKKDAPATAKSRKRKSPSTEDEVKPDAKAVKTRPAQDITNTSGVRRSARNAGKTVDYKSEVVKTFPEAISEAAKIAIKSERKANSERQNP